MWRSQDIGADRSVLVGFTINAVLRSLSLGSSQS